MYSCQVLSYITTSQSIFTVGGVEKNIIVYMEALCYNRSNLLCIYYVPGTVLGTGDSVKKEIHKDPGPYAVYIPVGMININQD